MGGPYVQYTHILIKPSQTEKKVNEKAYRAGMKPPDSLAQCAMHSPISCVPSRSLGCMQSCRQFLPRLEEEMSQKLCCNSKSCFY